jgi:ribonuclease E
MKRMLINATQAEELRVAIVDGQTLYDIDIEQPSKEQKKSNIYKGRIVRLEPSLEAAFVEYGGGRHGFLSLKEISRDYFVPGIDPNKASMKEFLREGQEIVVQVDKEERGNKGAALTTFISLAGRYMVLMPNSPTAGGVSRRIEGDDRQALKEAMDALTIPDDMGVIIRTAGVGRDAEELQWDLNYLLQVWKSITEAALSKPAPFLIYQESRLIIRALRDYLRSDVGEILVDTPAMYEEAKDFMQSVMPHTLKKLKMYTDDIPLFNRFQIESQIEAAYERTLRLPSGGSIVMDQTEALTAVDVNSSRATKGGDIEETAFQTNIEAAEEVARQLRLRDLGGLVVIDFIDMGSGKHQRMVEDRLQAALKHDRARVQIGKISRFGLLEMSRQRLRPSLGESSQIICPRCDGHGRMRSVESLSLSILRLAEEHAMKENTGQVLIQAPSEIANYLLNEKRRAIVEIETRHESPILIVADEQLETPHFNVSRLREGELAEEVAKPSYHRTTPKKLEIHSLTRSQLNIPVTPAVTHVKPTQPAPVREAREEVPVPAAVSVAAKKPGLFARIASFFGSAETSEPSATKTEQQEQRDRNSRSNNDRNQRNNRNPRDSRSNQQRPQQSRNQPQTQHAKPQQAAPQANKAPAPQVAKQPLKQEPLEQAPVLDEAKQLELQQRAEELKRKEMERREAQRQESYRREAERKAKREAERLAQLAAATAPPGADGEIQSPVDPEAADATVTVGTHADDDQSAEGARRRRGRRGGRRRRRPDQGPQDPNAMPNENSSADFDDEDGDEEETGSNDESAPEQNKPVHVAAFLAPVLVSSMPVTRAESEFDDLDNQPPAEKIAAVAAPAVHMYAEKEPEIAAVVTEIKESAFATPAFISPAPVTEKITVPFAETASISIEKDPKITMELPVTEELLASAPKPEITPDVVIKPVVPAAFSAPAPVAIPAATPVATLPASFSAPAPVSTSTPAATSVPAAFSAPAPVAATPIASVPPAFTAPASAAVMTPATNPVPAAFTAPAPVAAASVTPVVSVPPAFSVPAPAAFVAPKPAETLNLAQTSANDEPDNLEEGDQQKLI